MARGAPDWGQYSSTTVIAGLSDLGEAVARFGSPNLYDRRGNVVWWDDFEMGLQKWDAQAIGGDSSVEWSTEKARIGRYAAKLVGGDDVDKYASLAHVLPFDTRSRVGIEVAFTMDEVHGYVQVTLYHQTFDDDLVARIRINTTGPVIQYLDADGVYQTLATLRDFYTLAKPFEVLKLVVDFDAGTYARVIWSNKEYPLTAALNPGAGLPNEPYLGLGVVVQSIAGITSTSYVDDVIVTINEP